MRGSVKWWDDAKGFGFIKSDSGPDVFVHHTAILMDGRRTLTDGATVEFDVVPGTKGPAAQNVRVVEQGVP